MGVFCAFIEGQGGLITSPGMVAMAHRARADGIVAGLYTYKQIDLIAQTVKYRRNTFKDAVAAVGFSLGGNTCTALSAYHYSLDLLMALDPSQLGYTYKLDKKNTKRSVLWHDGNWLLDGPIGHAGLGLGFDVVHETEDFHLFVDLDPVIHANVRSELLALKAQSIHQ